SNLRRCPRCCSSLWFPSGAKTVKHHTASMMFTFSPGLPHPQPPNAPDSAD
ncbi:unnamed protein product, partial [Tetraodon nigroviridis]